MSASQRLKGAVYERRVIAWLNANGYQWAERRIAGMDADKGDVTGMGPVTLDCKDHGTMSLGAWCTQLEAEHHSAGTHVGAVVVHRKRNTDVGQDFAVMTMSHFIALIKEAGY